MNKPKLTDFDQIRMLVLMRKNPFLCQTFQELKKETNLTDGNLASKLRAMEMNGYVEVERGFNGKKRFTSYSITPIGQMRIHEYITAFNYIVKNTPNPEKTFANEEMKK